MLKNFVDIPLCFEDELRLDRRIARQLGIEIRRKKKKSERRKSKRRKSRAEDFQGRRLTQHKPFNDLGTKFLGPLTKASRNCPTSSPIEGKSCPSPVLPRRLRH